MPRQIAFLRAINVSGRRVKMDHLCELFADLGFGDVDSYLASGNVVFSCDETGEALEARIEAHLQDELGYAVETFLRTMDELSEVDQSSASSRSTAERST